MSNILLARIDDRLIHGQVMTSWVRFVKSKNILIIDDETYHDTFIRSFITMVVPRGIQIQVLDTKAGIAYLRDYDGAGLVLLAKYPQTFYLLLEGGIELHEIIIGGMGARENRKVLYKNICASDEELEVLKKALSQRYIGKKYRLFRKKKGFLWTRCCKSIVGMEEFAQRKGEDL